MKDPMGMSGFPMSIITHGNPTTRGDGFGILSVDGRGVRMSPGDGVFPITAGGTGEAAWVGIGSHPGVGVLPGFTGITGQTISVGVR